MNTSRWVSGAALAVVLLISGCSGDASDGAEATSSLPLGTIDVPGYTVDTVSGVTLPVVDTWTVIDMEQQLVSFGVPVHRTNDGVLVAESDLPAAREAFGQPDTWAADVDRHEVAPVQVSASVDEITATVPNPNLGTDTDGESLADGNPWSELSPDPKPFTRPVIRVTVDDDGAALAAAGAWDTTSFSEDNGYTTAWGDQLQETSDSNVYLLPVSTSVDTVNRIRNATNGNVTLDQTLWAEFSLAVPAGTSDLPYTTFTTNPAGATVATYNGPGFTEDTWYAYGKAVNIAPERPVAEKIT